MADTTAAPQAKRLTTRRALLAGGAAALAASGGYLWWARMPFDGATIDPPTAHRMAIAGDLLLIDIRRPDEWAATGIGEGANPLDMRRDDFVAALTDLAGGEKGRQIALICARGVRSNRVAQRLIDAGFTRIIDIPEGMLGSAAGPGWLQRGLPVRRP